MYLTLYHTIPTFNEIPPSPRERSPLKKLWEMEKMLVTSIFPKMFSTLSKTEMCVLATFILSSANAFNLVTSKILLFGIELKRLLFQGQLNSGLVGKWLTLTQTTNVRPFQTERIFR